MAADWKRYKIWDQWRAVSRTFGCLILAMEREAQATQKRPIEKQELSLVSGNSTFAVTAEEYISTLRNTGTLCGMVLQASLGLIEEHARDILCELNQVGVNINDLLEAGRTTIEERIEHYPPSNGIEDWGTKLLTKVGRQWSDVKPGLRGIVEVAVVRNALAHGSPIVSQRMLNRLSNVNGKLPWRCGDTIELNYDKVRLYRDRLRSFARVLADATSAILNEKTVSPPRQKSKRKN